MKTALIKEVDQAALLLKNGSVIAIPTETVYGLAARAFDPSAIKKIFLIKQRPADNPLIAHISSLEMGLSLISFWPKNALLLAQSFWPGPLTIVLPKKAEVPLIATAGLSTIGIRMPRHANALNIIEAVGQPLFAPSANLSGRPSPTQVKDVLEDLDGKIEAIFVGGECEVGIESTIISLEQTVPQILRPGSISVEELEAVLNMKIEMNIHSAKALAPGMKYRHYAPKAKIELIQDVLDAKGSFVLEKPSNQTLYRQFREADRQGASLISILIDEETQKNAGLMNRIEKAAKGD